MSALESMIASVESVDDVPAGGDLAADAPAGATTLVLADAAVFAEDGGMVELAPGVAVAYLSADLATDTLTLVAPSPVSLSAGDTVLVHPRSPRRVAHVIPEDGAPMAVTVPHALVDQVPTGLRDGGETVLVDLVDGAWTVRDVIGEPYRVPEEVRELAMEAANGRNSVIFSVDPASGTTHPITSNPLTVGDVWWQWDNIEDRNVIGQWSWSGSLWEQTQIGDEVIAYLTAAKIVTGELDAGVEIRAGSTTSGQAYMRGGLGGGLGFRVPDEEGTGTVTVAEMGRDWVSRDPATGRVTASITGSDGAFAGQSGDFAVLRVGGRDVEEALSSGAGVVVHDEPGLVERGPYVAETGYREVGFHARAGHVYTLECWLHLKAPSTVGGTHFTYLRATASGDPAVTIPVTISHGDIASNDLQISAGAEGRAYMSATYVPPGDRYVRLLTTARKGGDNGSGFTITRQRLIVRDEGLYDPQVTSGQWSLGGASGTTPPAAPPPQKYARWYDFDWGQAFQTGGRSSRPGTNIMRQGRIGAVSSNYPYASLLRIPDAARADVMGASKVRAWVQLTNIGWVDGAVIAGQSTATSNPTSMPTPIVPTAVGTLARGATKRLALPTSWESRWIAGTNRSLTLGRLDSAGYSDKMLDFPLTGDARTRARLYLEWER